jgi:NAD(P) transhydrogenase subunit alpha
VVEAHGVKIVGYTNVPGRVPVDASALYAKNLLNFLTPQFDKESKGIKFKWDDETVSGTCVARDGQVVHPLLKEGA